MSRELWQAMQGWVMLAAVAFLIGFILHLKKKHGSTPGSDQAENNLPGTNMQAAPGPAIETIKASDTNGVKAVQQLPSEKIPATVVETRLEFVSEAFPCYDLEALRNPHPDTLPMLHLFADILVAALDNGAWSFIIEPFPETVRVRYRRGDGWKVLTRFSASLYPQLITDIGSLFKMSWDLRSALPADGMIILKHPGGDWFEVWASTVHGVNGVILHIGFQTRERSFDLDLERLGFTPPDLEKFKHAVDAPLGLVAVAGPTFAGKLIVCYSAVMRRLQRGDTVATVESLQRFLLPGAHQITISRSENYDQGLKKALQHDPQVVMVRDVSSPAEFRAAMEAARAYRLVIVGMHVTNAVNAVNAFMRRHGVGVSAQGVKIVDPIGTPAHVAEALTLACAVRQVRRICPACREEIKTPAAAIAKAGLGIRAQGMLATFRGRGCNRCWGSGFFGQTGVYEVMPISPAIREMIAGDTLTPTTYENDNDVQMYYKQSQEWLQALAAKVRGEGVTSMREVALQKALAGITTVQEAILKTPEPYFWKSK